MVGELSVYFGEIENPFDLFAGVKCKFDNFFLELSHRIPNFFSMSFLEAIHLDQVGEEGFLGDVEALETF